MHVAQFAHACGEVGRGPAFGDLAPAPMGVKADEEVGGSVLPVLVVEASGLRGCRRLAQTKYPPCSKPLTAAVDEHVPAPAGWCSFQI